ncbi:hypothetical protein KV102_09940 [Mumia sp. zg.B53]|uniref:hypothetical protein n=1 Tax=unclassified Mumia TaxID=2621872 RepID=UPI001C6DDC50|nr:MULTISPECIES: hypothetical protein [unclassified Mumia]MBW9207117.1 hypothetical protein [Mumia sp. zg.B17]MBW9215159.1 hypothetical protein [Mumia sp. zg.B53]
MWTVEERDAFVRSGEKLARAILEYTESMSNLTSSSETREAFSFDDPLVHAIEGYSDALSDYANTVPPFAAEDEDEFHAPGIDMFDPAESSTQISVIARTDYSVVDREAFEGGAPPLVGVGIDNGDPVGLGEVFLRYAESGGSWFSVEAQGLERAAWSAVVIGTGELERCSTDEWLERLRDLTGNKPVFVAEG